MATFQFIADLVESLAWPATLLVLFFFIKTPLIQLFKYIVKIKYKNLEIDIYQELDRIKQDVPALEYKMSNEKETEGDQDILDLVSSSPSKAISEAWNRTEAKIYAKLKQLLPADSVQLERLTPDRAFNELTLTGALSPNAEDVLERLYFFKDRIERDGRVDVTKKIAEEYFQLCKYIQDKVSSLTEVPLLKLTALTYVIMEINAMVDKGRHQRITIKEIEKEVDRGTVLEFLRERGKDDIDLSLLFAEDSVYSVFREFYIEQLQNLLGSYAGNERRKWGIQNSGLCLLLAWTTEIIQQGSGWHPGNA